MGKAQKAKKSKKTKTKVIKSKPCDRCEAEVTIRYRIQYDETNNWYKVCPQCWEQVAHDNPNYRYGGTWKAKVKNQ